MHHAVLDLDSAKKIRAIQFRLFPRALGFPASAMRLTSLSGRKPGAELYSQSKVTCVCISMSNAATVSFRVVFCCTLTLVSSGVSHALTNGRTFLTIESTNHRIFAALSRLLFIHRLNLFADCQLDHEIR